MSGFWDDVLDTPKSNQQSMEQRVYPAAGEQNFKRHTPTLQQHASHSVPSHTALHTHQHPVEPHRTAHVQHVEPHRTAHMKHVQHVEPHRTANMKHVQHVEPHRTAYNQQPPSLKDVNPHRYLNHRPELKRPTRNIPNANTRSTSTNNTCMYVPGEGNTEGSIQCHADFGQSAQELNDRRS